MQISGCIGRIRSSLSSCVSRFAPRSGCRVGPSGSAWQPHPRSIIEAGATALLLLVASSARAQVPTETYRTPLRRIQVTSVVDSIVYYRVLYSEPSPSTVGRTYRTKRATFLTNWYPDTDSLRVGLLRVGAPVVWDSLHWGHWQVVGGGPDVLVVACMYMYYNGSRLVKKLGGAECPNPL